MAARQDTVRQQLKDAAAAADRLTESTTAHSNAVEDAKSEAEGSSKRRKTDAGRIAEQLRAQADVDAERIKAQGGRRSNCCGTQLSRQLRLELGHESVRQAGNWCAVMSPTPHSGRPPSTGFWTNSMPWRRHPAEVAYP